MTDEIDDIIIGIWKKVAPPSVRDNASHRLMFIQELTPYIEGMAIIERLLKDERLIDMEMYFEGHYGIRVYPLGATRCIDVNAPALIEALRAAEKGSEE